MQGKEKRVVPWILLTLWTGSASDASHQLDWQNNTHASGRVEAKVFSRLAEAQRVPVLFRRALPAGTARRAHGQGRWSFRDSGDLAEGMRRARMIPAPAERGRVQFVASGESLGSAPAIEPGPITLQWINRDNGACLGSRFEAGDRIREGDGILVARERARRD